MSDTPSKPREWVIWDDNVANGPTVPDDETVHVIEHSALVAAQAEIDRLKAEIEGYKITYDANLEERGELLEDIEKLKAELERANQETGT